MSASLQELSSKHTSPVQNTGSLNFSVDWPNCKKMVNEFEVCFAGETHMPMIEPAMHRELYLKATREVTRLVMI